MEQKIHVTIRDIARQAQVSPATVTRVLSDNGYPVRQEVRRKVLETARTLQYTPAAKRDRREITHRQDIGLLIPNISNPFYQQASLGAQVECQKNGSLVILCNTFRSKEREREYLHALFDKNIRGVVLSASSMEPDNLTASLSEYTMKGMHIVMLDQLTTEESICTNINFDNASGAALAVQHFLGKGHKKIAFCSTPLTRWSRKNLYQGFTDTLLQNRIELPGDYLLIDGEETELAESGYEFQSGLKMADEFVRRGLDATALLVVNDMMAIGVVKGLQNHKIRVPEDVSVIGLDNIPFSEMFTPALTTIHCPAFEIGRLAAQLLIDQMTSGEQHPLSIKLQPKLIRRDSVRDLTRL